MVFRIKGDIMKKNLLSLILTFTVLLTMPLETFAASSSVEITPGIGTPKSTAGIIVESGGTVYVSGYNYTDNDILFWVADANGNKVFEDTKTFEGGFKHTISNLSSGTYKLYIFCNQPGLQCHAKGTLSN